MKLILKTLIFCLSISLSSSLFGQIGITYSNSDFTMTMVELENDPVHLILDVLVTALVPMKEILIYDSQNINPAINAKKVNAGDKFHQIFFFPKGANAYSLDINCRSYHVNLDGYKEDGCGVDIDGDEDSGGN